MRQGSQVQGCGVRGGSCVRCVCCDASMLEVLT